MGWHQRQETTVRIAQRFGIIFFIVAFLTGCPQSALDKERHAVSDIATGLSVADKTVQQLYQQGALSVEESRRVELFIREATTLNDSLNGCVDLAKSAQPDTPAAVNAAACASSIVTQLRTGEALAVAGIHNPDSQAKFNVALSLVDTGISLLTQAISEFSGTPFKEPPVNTGAK